jgi:hypothetical protein
MQDISLKDKKKLEDFIKKLDVIRKDLKKVDYVNEREKFFGLMENFWKFLRKPKNSKLFKLFEHSKYYNKYKKFFNKMDDYYVRSFEAMEAVNIIAKSYTTPGSFLKLTEQDLTINSYKVVKREIELLDHSNCKTLAMVGSGPLPETILYIFENTNILKIIGIDNNQEAIYLAGEMISSIKKTPRIEFIHYDGLDYNYKNSDIVYIANFVYPKTEVLNRIAKTAKPGIKILIRNPFSFGKMLYDEVNFDKIDPRLTLIQKGKKIDYFLNYPLIFEKNDL